LSGLNLISFDGRQIDTLPSCPNYFQHNTAQDTSQPTTRAKVRPAGTGRESDPDTITRSHSRPYSGALCPCRKAAVNTYCAVSPSNALGGQDAPAFSLLCVPPMKSSGVIRTSIWVGAVSVNQVSFLAPGL